MMSADNSESGLLWGVDLGGTKIELVVFDAASVVDESVPQPILRRRVGTEQENGYQHILSNIGQLIEAACVELGSKPKRVGFGTPGALDPRSGQLRNSNTQCLNGKPIKADLEVVLGASVEIQNDANCFALAEYRWGAGRGYSSLFGVILGTGVGGGLIINGQPVIGLQGLGGEWGHNVICPEGPQCYCSPCYCGKTGCVEGVISGPALEAYYRSLESVGEEYTLHQLVERARAEGDLHAQATLDRLKYWFAKSLAVVINIVDPHCVVLGGGVSNIEELYGADVREEFLKNVFNDSVDTPILRNKLGDSAGVFGAAALCAA
jgi:fructokinase